MCKLYCVLVTDINGRESFPLGLIFFLHLPPLFPAGGVYVCVCVRAPTRMGGCFKWFKGLEKSTKCIL